MVHYRIPFFRNMLITFFLCILISQTFSQSRINVDKVIQPRKNRMLDDSTGLFANAYLDTTFFSVLRDTTVKRLSLSDSLRYNQFYQEFRQNYNQYTKVQNTDRTQEKIAALEKTINSIMQMLRLKPGEQVLRGYLSRLWNLVSPLYTDQGDSLKVLQINTSMIFITAPKIHFYRYLGIAQMYNRLNEYKLAIKAYNRTIENIFAFYADSLENGRPVFSNYLFSSLYGRGNCEEKLYLDELALRSRQHSLAIAPESYKKGIEYMIKSKLLWDDGNLPAYEKKNEGLKILQEKRYREAKQYFLNLLPELKTRSAEIEIQRYIAQAEFLNSDSYLALEHVQKIVNNFPFDSPQFDSTEVDSIYQSYVEFYAQLCFTQGYREWQVGNLRNAYIYFSRAAELPSRFEAQACFWLARLLMVKNSVMHADQLIDYGLKAWNNEKDPLPNAFKKQLASVMFRAYQQKGDFAEATTWFQRFHTIEN